MHLLTTVLCVYYEGTFYCLHGFKKVIKNIEFITSNLKREVADIYN